MGFFSSVFNPGKKHLKRSSRALRRARFTGGNINMGGGLSGGFSFNDDGTLKSSQSLGEFAPFLQQLFGLTGEAFGRAEEGGLADQIAAGFAPQLDRLADIFQSSADIASQDPLERGAHITDLLRQRSERGNQNLVNKTFDRLFASGGLSSSVAREEVTGDLRRFLADEDLGFQLAGIEQGEQSVQHAFMRALGAQQAQEQNIGFTENLRNMFLQQGGAGLNQSQNLATLPMQLMGMLAGIQGQRSQTELGIAAGHQNNAQLAESTFMNFSKWLAEYTTLHRSQSASSGLANLGSAYGSVMGGGGGMAGGMGGFAAMSDRRLKRNITHVGTVDGVNIYSYDYIDGSPGIGVMADEVPHASFDVGGYKAVDYSRVWS